MRVVVAIVLCVVLSCCHPDCPTLPARGVTPAPVVTVAPPLPCELPELPGPIQMVGFPSPDGQQIYVSTTDFRNFAVYLAGMRAWIVAAAICLEHR